MEKRRDLPNMQGRAKGNERRKEMRTITRKTTVYKFDELPKDAQDKAIERLADINVDGKWWDFAYEDAKQIGLKLTGFDIDGRGYCKGDFMEGAHVVAENIKQDHGESCETYKDAVNYLKERDEVIDATARDENRDFEDEYELEQKLDELDTEFLRTLLEDYRIMLQHEYEDLTSRKGIIETIEANDYDFTEDGKIFS